MRNPLISILLCSLALATGACRSDSAPLVAGEIRHPTSSNEYPQDAAFPPPGVANDSKVSTTAARLRAARGVLTIGALGAPKSEVFGRIQVAHFDTAGGGVAILDGRFNEIRVFSLAGQHLRTVGGPGSGPREFRAPISFLVAQDGSYLVADRPYGLKWLFGIEGEGRRDRSIQLRFAPDVLCEAPDGSVWIYAWRADGSYIHRIANTLVVESIGEGYVTTSPLAQRELTQGPLGCTEDGHLASAFSMLPYVFVTDPKTRDKQIYGFERFDLGEMVERYSATGQRSITTGGASHSQVVRLQPLRGGEILVQVAQRWVDAAGVRQPDSVYTYLLDYVARSTEFVGSELGLIDDVTDSLLVTVSQEPFPTLTVAKWD